jgi:alanine-synthesizing transaminase
MDLRFSRRTGWDMGESELAAAIRRARASGRRLYDLTISNPTVCGFSYDAEWMLGGLRDERALVYDPDPCGMRSAREAVAEYYAGHGAGGVDPDRLVLTTSTSEGYGYLFRLMCDAGDEVLVAQPSYPLFDFLADLEDVRLTTYPLFYDYGWWIDFAELERRVSPQTKAIVVVNPNNPTGNVVRAEERLRLEEICARHGLALIVDEVFLDYPVAEGLELKSFALGPHPVLTFCLSGMSKIAGLPQMKVGWIGVFGPDGVRAEALGRLEVVADTFLSMNTPVQLALPKWLAGRQGIQELIRARVRRNLAAAQTAGLEVLEVEGGWSAIVRLEQRGGGKNLAVELLQMTGVVVHPGAFYGIAAGGNVVVSLIVPEGEFADGVQRLSEWNT